MKIHWLQSPVLLAIVWSACAAPLAAAVRLEGNKATFATSAMVVTVEDGSITRIFNIATGTDYVVARTTTQKPDTTTGLVYAVSGVTQKQENAISLGPTSTEKGARVLVPALRNLEQLGNPRQQQIGDAVEYRFGSGNAWLTIRYSLDPETGDLLIDQRGGGSEKGLAAVRFGLGPISCNGNLLLPAMFGIKAARGNELYTYESSTWQWPVTWQLPLIIFEDPNGGVWVHAEDTALRFKSVHYQEEKDKGVWSLGFDTQNNAPFPAHDSIQSVTWRVSVYTGDWTGPVDRYKRWSYAANHMNEKQKARPAWVDDIRLMVKHADYMDEGQMAPFLDALQAQVDPRKTLLYIDRWSDASKGMILPYWIASPRGIKFTDEAHKRGFRVMYMVNYLGITPTHPRFAEFKQYVIRHPYSGQEEGWNLKGEWKGTDTPQLYYVSPAAKAWRDYDIGQFQELFAKHPAEGLFIDQSYLIFNDANGLVDGKTTIEGNLAYHKQLTDALPGVAIGGESVNEISMQYESFCEIHPLSLHTIKDSQGKLLGWQIDPGAFDRMVPIVSRFLLPHTRPVGYVGYAPTSSPYYTGWRDSLRIYQGVPTLTRPTAAELNDAESEARRVIRDAFSR